MNLKLKLGYLSSQKKIQFFQRHILSKAFCHFPNVRMRTNAFREEAFAGPVFPLRKFYIEKMFVSARMQVQNHVQTQLVKRYKR